MKPNFGLSEDCIEDLAQELNKVLANTYLLYVKTLNCHWNMEDPRFLFLHEMLQDHYENLAKNGDTIAERIRQMGKIVHGSLKAFLQHGEIEEIQCFLTADEMLLELSSDHEKMVMQLRHVIEKSDQYQDPGLTDLLSKTLRFHEKTAWILRSHFAA